MKTKHMYLAILLLFPLVFWGCSEESGDEPGPVRGVEKEISLTIKTQDETTKTRSDQTYGNEGQINGNVRVYVYDKNGVLEYKNENMTLTNSETEKFRITTGEKYFYVFANTGTYAFESQTLRPSFEKQILPVDFNVIGGVTIPDLANVDNGYFFMGTLWADQNNVTQETNDLVINLDIGRMVAKVKLWDVQKETTPGYSNMKGTFSDFSYRLASVPNKTYLVGQFTGTKPPGAYDTVESAVHTVPKDAENTPEQDRVYRSYPEFINVTKLPDPPGTALTEFFYAVENTTQKDQKGDQYWGNTTHIRLKSKYKPHETDEVYDNSLTNKVNFTGGTFWTAELDGKLYLANGLPTRGTNIKEYTDGWNYHKFVIRDPNQVGTELQYTVLRNHYYEINVTGIRNLGENKDEDDPNPIPTEQDVIVNVQVVNWSKIVHSPSI